MIRLKYDTTPTNRFIKPTSGESNIVDNPFVKVGTLYCSNGIRIFKARNK